MLRVQSSVVTHQKKNLNSSYRFAVTVLYNLNPKFCIGRCSHFLHLVNHFALTIAFPIIFIHLVAMDDLYQEQCELWQKLEACFKTLSSKSKAEQTRGFAEAQQIRLERCFLLVKENNKTTKKS